MDELYTIAGQYIKYLACCDFQKIKQLLHEQYTYISCDGQIHQGPDRRFDMASILLNAIPDLSFDIKNTYQSGNTIIIEFTMRGTHQREMMGILPGNRQIAVVACSIIEIHDNMVYSEREYYDLHSLRQQLKMDSSSNPRKNNLLLA